MTDEAKRNRLDPSSARRDIREILSSALQAADAGRLVASRVRLEGPDLRVGRERYRLDEHSGVSVYGIGKAAAHMAAPLEDVLGERIAGGLVIVKDGYAAPLRRIDVMEGGHPVPDRRSVAATRAMIDRLRRSRGDELVLFLVSGGGSSLLVKPADGLSLDEKVRANRALLQSGAPIEEINAVRRHLSAVKGGGLIPTIHPATLVNLVLSDVVGDPLELIASGPTVPPRTTGIDPIAVVERYGLRGKMPERVLQRLRNARKAGISASTAPPEIRARVDNVLIGNNRSLLDGARRKAEALGYEARILTSELKGEAREEAERLSRIAIDMKRGRRSSSPPLCLLIGGETTVTVRGKGIGGRCTEFALSAAISVSGEEIVVLAAGSDGTDGPTDAAGAISDGETCRRARRAGLDPMAALRANDSYPFFESIGDLVVTGPTRTNVMDLYAFIV